MKRLWVLVGILVFCVNGVWGDIFTWTGGGGSTDTYWQTPGNWSGGSGASYPSTNDTAIINSILVSPIQITVTTSPIAIGSLELTGPIDLGGSVTVTIRNSLTTDSTADVTLGGSAKLCFGNAAIGLDISSGDVRVTAINSPLGSINAVGEVTLGAAYGQISQTVGAVISGSVLTVINSSDVTLTENNKVDAVNITATGKVDFKNGNSSGLTVTGVSSSGTAAITITETSGDIAVNGAISTVIGAVTVKAAGDISISNTITGGAVTVAVTGASGAVSQSGADGITGTILTVTAGGPVTLTAENSVSNIAIAANGAVGFKNTRAAGLTVSGGVSSSGNNITIFQTVGKINVNSEINSGNGTVTLNSDEIAMDTSGGNRISAGSGTVKVRRFTDGDMIVGGTFATHLTDAEIGTISARVLDIGNRDDSGTAAAMDITVGAVSNSGTLETLLLRTKGGINSTIGAVQNISKLAIQAKEDVSLTLGSSLEHIAVDTDGNITIAEDYVSPTGFIIDTIEDVVGINAGSSVVTLNTVAWVGQNAPVQAGGILLWGAHTGAITLADGDNEIGTIAVLLTGTGAVSLTNRAAGGIALGTVASINGITTDNQDVTITQTAGPIMVNQQISAGSGRITLASNAGSVTGAGKISTAGELTVTADAAINLSGANEAVAVYLETTSAIAGDIVYASNLSSGLTVAARNGYAGGKAAITEAAGTLTVGTVNGVAGITAGTLTLDAAGGITQSAAISAGGLLLLGVHTGAINLVHTDNEIGTIAASLTGTGAVSLVNRAAGGIALGTVVSINGITTDNQDVTIAQTAGPITVNQQISAGSGKIRLVSGAGSVIGAGKISTAGELVVIADAAINLSGANEAVAVHLETTSTIAGDIVYTSNVGSSGHVTAAARNGYAGGKAAITEAAGTLTVGTVNSVAGITAGTLTLGASEGITQTEAISAGGLLLLGVHTGAILLGHTDNEIGTIAASLTGTGAVSLTNRAAGGIVVGTVESTNGITATNQDITITQTAGPITVNQQISAGSGKIRLVSGVGSVTGAGKISTAGELVVIADIAINLSGANEAVAVHLETISTIAGDIVYTSNVGSSGHVTAAVRNGYAGGKAAITEAAGTLTVGTVNSVAGITAGTLTLGAAGGITQTEAISAGGLLLLGVHTGAILLGHTDNEIGTIAASLTGSGAVSLTNRAAGGIAVGTVESTNGITAANQDITITQTVDSITVGAGITVRTLTLSAAGGVTQAEAISAEDLLLLGANAGAIILMHGSNTINNFAMNLTGGTGTVSLKNNAAGGLTIGTVASTQGITASGQLITITQDPGGIMVTEDIGIDPSAGSLVLNANAGFELAADITGQSVTLDNSAAGTGSITQDGVITAVLLKISGRYDGTGSAIDLLGSASSARPNALAEFTADITGTHITLNNALGAGFALMVKEVTTGGEDIKITENTGSVSIEEELGGTGNEIGGFELSVKENITIRKNISAGGEIVFIGDGTLSAVGTPIPVIQAGAGKSIIIHPLTKAIGINDPGNVSGEVLNITTDFLKRLETGKVIIGGTTYTGMIYAGNGGAINLTGTGYDLDIIAAAASSNRMEFRFPAGNETLTLGSGKTLGVNIGTDAAAVITRTGDAALDIAADSLVLTAGHGGSAAQPLLSSVHSLGSLTVSGSLYLSNNQDLEFAGTIAAQTMVLRVDGNLTQETGSGITGTILDLSTLNAITLENNGNSVTGLRVSSSGGDISYSNSDPAGLTVFGADNTGAGRGIVIEERTGGIKLGQSGTALTIKTEGGSITLKSPVTLEADITISTKPANGNGGDIRFESTLDGPFNLALDASVAGTGTSDGVIQFLGKAGNTVPIGNSGSAPAISITGTANAVFSDTLHTANGIHISSDVLFSDNVIIGTGDSDTKLEGQARFEGTLFSFGNNLSLGTDENDIFSMTDDFEIDGIDTTHGEITLYGLIETPDTKTITISAEKLIMMPGSRILSSAHDPADPSAYHITVDLKVNGLEMVVGVKTNTVEAGNLGEIKLHPRNGNRDIQYGDVRTASIMPNPDFVYYSSYWKELHAGSYVIGAGDYDGSIYISGVDRAAYNLTVANNTLNPDCAIIFYGNYISEGRTLDLRSGGVTLFGGATIDLWDAGLTISEDIMLAPAYPLPDSTETSVAIIARGGIIIDGNIRGTADAKNAITFNRADEPGSIEINGTIGGVPRLGMITLPSASTAVFNGSLTAAGFEQQAGNGNTLFNAPADLSGNFTFTGNELSVNAALNVGGLTCITNAGTFTKTGDALNTLGGFIQNGSADNRIGSDITTAETDIIFASDINLIGAVLFSTGTTGIGNITLNAPVKAAGAESISLEAADGDIAVSGVMGETGIPLGTITVISAGDATFNEALIAAGFEQQNGSGTTVFKAPVDLSGNLTFVGNELEVQDALSTGGLTGITNAGAFTKTGTSLIAAGGFVQNGAGINTLGSDITTAETDITFASDITLISDINFSTGESGIGNIVLGAAVKAAGAESITLTAAEGDVELSGAAGENGTPLGTVTVTGNNVTVQDMLLSEEITIVNSGIFTVDTHGDILPQKQMTVAGPTVNKGAITAGTPGTPSEAALTFAGDYTGEGTGIICGNPDPDINPYSIFLGNVTFNDFAPPSGGVHGAGFDHAGDYLVFAGPGDHAFKSGENPIGRVRVQKHADPPGVIGEIRLEAQDVFQVDTTLEIITGVLNVNGRNWTMDSAAPAPAAPAGVFTGLNGELIFTADQSSAQEERGLRAGAFNQGAGHKITVNHESSIIVAGDASLGGVWDLSDPGSRITLTLGGKAEINWTHTGDLENLKKSTIVMDGGTAGSNVHLDAQKEIGNLTVLGQVSLDRNLTVLGNVDIGSAEKTSGCFLDAGSAMVITLRGNWNNRITGPLSADAFNPRSGELRIEKAPGEIAEITGNTQWYDFVCEVPGVIIQFSNYPHEHRVRHALKAKGQEGNFITLTRIGHNTGPNPADDTDREKFWYFILGTGSVMELDYLNIYYSYASRQLPIPSGRVKAWPFRTQPESNFPPEGPEPPDLDRLRVNPPDYRTEGDAITVYVNHYTINWLERNKFFYSFTEDSDGNGRIDRIRSQAAYDLNGQFDGFDAEVEGYRINRNKGFRGFARAGDDQDTIDSIFIYLIENDYADGDARPKWRIKENTTLFDLTTGVILIGDPNDGDMETFDTAFPRITYTFMLPKHNQIFVQFSEPVKTGSGSFAYPGSMVEVNPLSTDDLGRSPEFVLTLTGLPDGLSVAILAEELAGSSGSAPPPGGNAYFTVSGITDEADIVPDLDTDPLNPFPSPRYPRDWKYNGYLTVRGNPPVLPSLETALVPPNRIPMDTADPAYPNAASHRVTDVLISMNPASAGADSYFVWPVWAVDNDTTGIPEDTSPAPAPVEFGLIHNFTGKGQFHHLQDRNITLQVKMHDTIAGLFTPQLFYGNDVQDEYRARTRHGPQGLWLPYFNTISYDSTKPDGQRVNLYSYSNMVPKPFPLSSTQSQSVSAQPAAGNGSLFNFSLREDFYGNRSMLDFFLRLNHTSGTYPEDLYIGRLDAAPGVIPLDWYRLVRPFSFEIHNTTLQRSGVTILNNVINPTTGEKVYLDYKLNRAGPVTIQVYTLDGTLVRSLVRENKNPGEYRTYWDGKNNGGRVVARGMYFIRSVAPEIDEIRKVMVVK